MNKMFRLLTALLLPLVLLTACGGNGAKKESGKGSPLPGLSLPSLAPFEGIMYMTTTIPEAGTSETKFYIGKKGVRTETTLNMKNVPSGMQTAMISPSDSPNLVYLINEAERSYMVIDIEKMQEEVAKYNEIDPYKDAVIENLGKETVNGFTCSHIRITRGEDVSEMWVSKDVLDYFTYARMQSAREKNMPKLAKRLKDAGLDGFPVKSVLKKSGVTTELTRVERTGLDNSLFEVPAGYTKTEMPALGGEGMSPKDMERMKETARKMQERMQKQQGQ
jgi:hypothetical protein